MAEEAGLLRRVVNRGRRAARDAVVRSDLASFRRQARGLRGARPRRDEQGVVLIVSLSDFVYQLKLEAVIGTALRLAGLRPVVLTLPSARWAHDYFRAAGIPDLVTPVEELPAGARVEADAAAAEALAGGAGVQELKTLEFHGVHVGQQTLSTLSRTFERGRISLADPAVRAALERQLPDAMRATIAAELLLNRLCPDLVVFNEKGYAGFGSIYDAALRRDANVVQYVAAGIHARDALLFKRYTDETRRVHPASLSAASWQLLRDLPWTEERERALQEEFTIRYGSAVKHPDAGLQEGKRIKTTEEVRRQLGLDPGKKTAILFSHVLWDANLFFGDDLFEDQEAWLVETVRAACANPSVNWVVKLHPANLYKSGGGELNDEVAIREAVGELPPHVRLVRPETDINTYSLFAIADYGLTIRGTIGMELPCFGVPVLTAGTGRYSGLGFTVDSESAEQYLDRIAHIHKLAPLSVEQTLLAKRHAYGLFRLRPFRFTSYRASFMPLERLGHPLSHNLNLSRSTPAEVETADDLIELGEWMLDRHRLDYLGPE